MYLSTNMVNSSVLFENLILSLANYPIHVNGIKVYPCLFPAIPLAPSRHNVVENK